jgi:outer membrane immunogenic protein
MKTFIALAATAFLCAIASPALAEGEFSPTTFYVNAGYTAYHISDGAESATLSALGGRVGARFGKYLGVEGEAGFGVNTANFSGANVKFSSEVAGYVVGYFPVDPHGDVFARVGYGHETASASAGGPTVTASENTVNFGGGGQYFFTANDGVRLEYTRYQPTDGGDGGSDTVSIAYVRKF